MSTVLNKIGSFAFGTYFMLFAQDIREDNSVDDQKPDAVSVVEDKPNGSVPKNTEAKQDDPGVMSPEKVVLAKPPLDLSLKSFSSGLYVDCRRYSQAFLPKNCVKEDLGSFDSSSYLSSGIFDSQSKPSSLFSSDCGGLDTQFNEQNQSNDKTMLCLGGLNVFQSDRLKIRVNGSISHDPNDPNKGNNFGICPEGNAAECTATGFTITYE